MNFREYFDVNPEIIQLNSGTLSISPRAVKQAVRHFRDEYEKNPAQSLFDTWEKMWIVQKDLAQFFNADPKDLILRTNVTIAMNEFLMGVQLPANSEILVSDLEYGAIVNICKYRAQRDGHSVRAFHLPGHYDELQTVTEKKLVNMVISQLTPNTKMVMLSHVTTGSGLRLPINAIGSELERRGIIFAVDGAHAPGAIKLDFSQMNCDFYGTNLHKWMMGPKGTGFGWFHPRIKDRVQLSFAGWTTFEIPKPFLAFGDKDSFATKWMISSSYDFAPYFAIQNMLKFWRSVGEENIWRRQKDLGRFLIGAVKEQLGWKCLSELPDNLTGPLYAFEIPARLAEMDFDLMNKLKSEHRLQVAMTCIQGKWHMRLAPQVYNTEEEILEAVKVLKSI